jgi:MFS family permease
MVNRRWLFVCSCIALVTSAFTFIVRGDILQDMGNAFLLTQEQKGGIEGAVFMGMALSMVAGGLVCDMLGMKLIMIIAFACHLGGALATIFAPHSELSYPWLYAASLLMGCGNGMTEVGVNPLIATLYADRKTHYLNILHAWWPGGLVIGGITVRLVGKGLDLGFLKVAGLDMGWQWSLGLIVLPAFVYGLMLIPAKFPSTERVASGVSTGDMFKECLRPLFLIWGFCMLLTAATELGPQKWQESVMSSVAGISGTQILVYTSGMMFILRHFAGPIAHALSPTGMLTGSAILAGVGLYLLSFANNAATAFGYATIFGLGIAFFWPTMLGVTAERFPRGGALALALMGSMGNLSISQVLPQMGHIVDTNAVTFVEKIESKDTQQKLLKYDDAKHPIGLDPVAVEKLPKDSAEAKVAAAAQEHGYRMAFRTVAMLPIVLVCVFVGIILYDRSRGGYKPEVLLSREEENELMAGGVQGAVE